MNPINFAGANLTTLLFGGNALGDAGMEKLCAMVKKASQLTSLDVSSNSIGPQGCVFLAAGKSFDIKREYCPKFGIYT